MTEKISLLSTHLSLISSVFIYLYINSVTVPE